MAKIKGMMFLNFILAFFILIALIDTATTRIFDFNLILLISFQNIIAETIIAGVVGVLGLIGLIILLTQAIMMLVKK